ncbi:MarR family transcriptional regulator [Pseudomonas sp. RGM2987]|uniref:MarR family winged helix-turn-helix transcriptional regulator n=1 Tax=Pseudomonas sp. RGM2987 TaxID=2930090 RepID=UPI001FD72465|nr:MarR family transcriptional regulator [Pseudomonas sp. RGM2987]MCJ8208049.1 MarR family transcriptional regulator [Pseudomonas sp. RGM2987]
MKTLHGADLCHCLAARRHARLLTRLYDRHLSAVNLTVSQFSTLAVINEHPGILIAELAEIMVMERTTLVRALKPLQNEGYIASHTEGPRAAIKLSLSVQGRAKLKEADPHWEAAQREREDQVGDASAVLIRNLLLEQVIGE